MNLAFLIQLAVSAIAVGLMIGLAAWATRGRGAPPLDEPTARRWLADEFPTRKVESLWIAADGQGAVAKSGDRALILTRMGDGYAARATRRGGPVAPGRPGRPPGPRQPPASHGPGRPRR